MSESTAQNLDDLPPIPSLARIRDGAKFDPTSDIWHVPSLRDRMSHFDFRELTNLTAAAIHKLKLTFLNYLETASYSHFRNTYHRLLAFHREELSKSNEIYDRIEIHQILNYRATLNRETEWKLGTLRILLSHMEDLGYGICSEDTLHFLQDASIKGTLTGTAVRTRDPHNGAFNDGELLSIQSALNSAYAKAEIDLPTFALGWIFLAYGSRPIQIAALKECDFITTIDNNGDRFYTIMIPRAKQRGQMSREAFKIRYCGKQLGHLLELLLDYNKSLKLDASVSDDQWPLFIGPDRGSLAAFPYHLSARQLGEQISTTLRKITGLKANPKRFRITLAQRAVDDGKDKYTVAELLDHSNTDNVGVYFEASPAMVERLDRRLAMELIPLAQAFSGVLVGSEQKAWRGDDPSSRIYDKTLRSNIHRPLGTCGQMSFCGLNAPFACYTCRHFQPWIDAPHSDFLSALTADRDRMVAEGYSAKIYNIKNRTILAVAEVIQLCTTAAESSRRDVA